MPRPPARRPARRAGPGRCGTRSSAMPQRSNSRPVHAAGPGGIAQVAGGQHGALLRLRSDVRPRRAGAHRHRHARVTRSTRLPATSLPSAINCSMASAASTTRSKASPAWTRVWRRRRRRPIRSPLRRRRAAARRRPARPAMRGWPWTKCRSDGGWTWGENAEVGQIMGSPRCADNRGSGLADIADRHNVTAGPRQSGLHFCAHRAGRDARHRRAWVPRAQRCREAGAGQVAMRLFGAEERRARGPRACSALRALTRCDCLSVANASSRSELSNGATRSSTTGQSAQPTAEPKLRGLPCTGFAVTEHQARTADGEVQLCAVSRLSTPCCRTQARIRRR